jgi:magnesium transporter
MLTVFTHAGGRTERSERLDPTILRRNDVSLWVDLANPTPDEIGILSGAFGFHELSIEDAVSELHHPKVEDYQAYLYVILHGIDFKGSEHRFATQDIDFFLGPNYLVTVHDDRSRSVKELRDVCARNTHAVGEGPAALMHRIVDAMVDHYRPEVDKLDERIDGIEREVFSRPRPDVVKRLLTLKRDIMSLRRVVLPERDVVNRLGRREFDVIPEGIAYRFRDVYDHLVRITDESIIFQDRLTGLIEAHLSAVSNRLNQVMKVLTVISTIFMPLTVLTGMWGMNVPLPTLPGGDGAQFWWVLGLMLAISGLMLGFFRVIRWL